MRLKNGDIFQGVANIGKRPTINGVKQLLEVHLFNFDRDLYGQSLQIEFFCHKFAMKKFPSLNALKNQIENDVVVAKSIFSKS